MDLEKQGNQIIHNSRFRLTVDHGSFDMPYELSYERGDELSPIELARMIRSALYHGQQLEWEAHKHRARTSCHVHDA